METLRQLSDGSSHSIAFYFQLPILLCESRCYKSRRLFDWKD